MPLPKSTACAKRSTGRRRCSPMSASSRTPRPTSSRQSARSSPGTGASSMPSQADWIESLTPWPEEFGLARMRTLVAELVGATQFEALTAAAFVEFAEANVDVAVVEAGLGGRLDATNILGAEVVV